MTEVSEALERSDMKTIARILIGLQKWRNRRYEKRRERYNRSRRRREIRRARREIIETYASDIDLLSSMIPAHIYKEAAASLGMQVEVHYNRLGSITHCTVKKASDPTQTP